MKRFGFTLFSLCALGVLYVLVSLGNWQVDRLAWKENLIATVNERIAGEARSLADIEDIFVDTLDVDYYPVIVEGTFLHDGEAHYNNTYQGASGWNVFTPFKLTDGRILFINRGFVPYANKEASTRLDGQVEGLVSFRGLTRNAPAQKPSVPDNDLVKNQFHWRDLTAMAANAGYQTDGSLLPFFVYAEAEATPEFGMPLAGTTRITFRNSHLGYIITWYGLALTLVGVYIALVLKRRKERNSL